MEIMDDLFKIKVEYAEKLIIYFLKEYKTKKHIKSLDYAMKVIKSNMHEIVNAYYVFDETIWLSSSPDDYDNLIKIIIQFNFSDTYHYYTYRFNEL